MYLFGNTEVNCCCCSLVVVTANSRLAETSAITDKIQIRGLTENASRRYGITLFRTQNDVPKVSALTKVDCI